MMLRNLILLLLAGGLVTSCLDVIDLEAPEKPTEAWAMQGKLIKGDPSYAEVKIDKLFVYTSNLPQFIRDANVTIEDEDGNSLTFPEPTTVGIYNMTIPTNSPDFQVEEGKSYRIRAQLVDGRTIVSDFETILPVPEPTAISFAFERREVELNDGLLDSTDVVSFAITTPLIAEGATAKSRLRWEFLDAYRVTDDNGVTCYVQNPARTESVFVVDGSITALDTIREFGLFTIPRDQRFYEGYYLSAYQQSVSARAYEYWRQVATLGEQEGTIFEDPAGTVISNMHFEADSTEQVFGYFTAIAQDTVRVFVSREDAGNPSLFCPRPPRFPPPQTICDNCLIWLNSSDIKPDYWEE